MVRLRVELPEGPSEWQSVVPLFRIGRGDACALRFEGAAAKYSSWEHAEFRVDGHGGVSVTDLGSSNGTYVNGERITDPTALAPGDTVQIGTKGPRLHVLELPVCSVGVSPASPRSGGVSHAAVPAARPQIAPLYVAIAAGALLGTAGLFLFRGGKSDPPAAVPAKPTSPDQLAPGSSGNPPAEKRPELPPFNPSPANPPNEPADEQSRPVSPPPSPPSPADPWAAAKASALPAYRLLVVEDPKTQTAWPYMGAVVVAPRALLTTAEVGVELAKFRQREMTIKAVRDSQDTGTAIDKVRIHTAYQKATPEEQLFFDLALISTAGDLTGTAAQPSAADLAAIERGLPLACPATIHSGDPIDRFQQLSPEWQTGKLFAVTALSSEAGAPRLLQVRGVLSDKSSGSPIFNDRGELVALYCEAAPDDGGGRPDRALHYAKLIEPKLIELGLSKSENSIWVEPDIPPPEAQKEPKP